jgi:hypothetical protein
VVPGGAVDPGQLADGRAADRHGTMSRAQGAGEGDGKAEVARARRGSGSGD